MDEHDLSPRAASCCLFHLLVMAAVMLLLSSDTRIASAQSPPQVPTAPSRAPLGEPRPARTLIATPEILPAPTAVSIQNVSLPSPTATPVAGIQVAATPVAEDASTGRAYRMSGTVSLRSTQADGAADVQRGEYVVSVLQVSSGTPASANRQLQFLAYESELPVWEVMVYEVGAAAITIASSDEWSIQPRSRQAQISRALQPVFDLAEVALAICERAETSDPERAFMMGNACVLTNSEQIASLLAHYETPLRVTSSLLTASVDQKLGKLAKYYFRAELVQDTETLEPATYSIEWTFERTAIDEEDATAALIAFNSSLDGPVGQSVLSQTSSPIFSMDALPSPERILLLSRSGSVLHLEIALTSQEANEAILAALKQNGWQLKKTEAIVATRANETVVVLLSGGGEDATTSVDLVRVE